MSRSTLPDLFKADMFMIKFHPDDRPRKIGGRFSIKPAKNVSNQQSQQKQNQLNKLQASNGFSKSIYDGIGPKYRSQSIGNMTPAIKYDSTTRNNPNNRHKKSVVFDLNPNQQLLSMNSNNSEGLSKGNRHSQSLTKDTLTLKQIHYQNVMRNKILSSNVNRSKQLSVGLDFPYESNRTMNNLHVELEQAQSFKNRVETMVKQELNCQRLLKQAIKQGMIIKQHMGQFHQFYLADLEEFNSEFHQVCRDLMKTLTRMRRQTNQQIKQNQFDLDRVGEEYRDCEGIFEVIDYRANVLRGECIEDQKLEMTNRMTYSMQDIQMRVQRSVRESELDKVMRRNSKRAGTSQTVRNTIENLTMQGKKVQKRAQTSSIQRRPQNSNNLNKDNKDDDDNFEINIRQLDGKQQKQTVNHIKNDKQFQNRQNYHQLQRQNEQILSQKESLEDIDINIQNIRLSNFKQIEFYDDI